MVEGEILSFFSYDNDPHFLPYSGVLMLRGLKFETDGGHEIDGYMCTCIYVCGDMVHACLHACGDMVHACLHTCGDMVHACGDMSTCMWGHVYMHVGTCLRACGDM